MPEMCQSRATLGNKKSMGGTMSNTVDTEHLVGLMRGIWSTLEYDFEYEQYFESLNTDSCQLTF